MTYRKVVYCPKCNRDIYTKQKEKVRCPDCNCTIQLEEYVDKRRKNEKI